MTAELTKGEYRRLSRLAARGQCPAQGRAGVAGQAEAERQRGQLVEVNPDGGPRGSAGVGAWIRRKRQAGQRTEGSR